MNNKALLSGIGALLVLCICAGVAGFFYRDTLMSILGLERSQQIAQLLPEETSFYTAITPNLQNLAGYDNIKTLYLDDPEVQALIEEFKTTLKDEENIDFDNDILPWLGSEVGFAITNFENINEPGGDPNVLIAAETRDIAALDTFIQKEMEKEKADGGTVTEDVYQEITIYTMVPSSEFEEPTLVAGIGNIILFSNNDVLIKGAIDRSKDENLPSLASSQRYQKLMSNLPTSSAATLYFDVHSFVDLIMQDMTVELPAEQMQSLEAVDGLAMGVTLESNGINFNGVFAYDTNKMTEEMQQLYSNMAPISNDILTNVPNDALLFYILPSLQTYWQQMRQGFEANPEVEQQFADMEAELGLSLDEDIFSWMTGDSAMVLVETTPPDEFTPPFGGYVLLGTDDVANAQTHVDKILGVLNEQGGLPPFETQTINGTELSVFGMSPEEILVGYGFYNSYFLLGYPGEALEIATSAKDNAVTSNTDFQAVREKLPAETATLIYVNGRQIRSIAEAEMSEFDREDYQKYVKPWVDPIQAIGAGGDTNTSNDGLIKSNIFILLSE